jgi:hypothetical protein
MPNLNDTTAEQAPGRLDPYLLWADATDFRDYPTGSNDLVAVAVECLRNETVDTLVGKVSAEIRAGRFAIGDVVFPWLYRLPISRDIHFCSVRVKRSRLTAFAALVLRLELGLAVQAEASAISPLVIKPEQRGPLIGLIDDHFAVANRTFSMDGEHRSRFLAVWSQGEKIPVAGAGWRPAPDGFGFVWSRGPATPRPERGPYPLNQRRFTHGTHVASLAAGRKSSNDFAGDAELVGVQFPREVIEDTSGGAMTVQVLDAIHFILAAANPNNLSGESVRRVVINLSYGTNAGAHDGTSILEAAMDELLALRKGRLAIIVPAGNQRESRGHVRLGLNSTAGESPRILKWQVLPDGGTPSFMEVWLPKDDAGKMSITVISPSGRRSPVLVHGDTWTESDASWGVYFPLETTGSDLKSGVLIAVAATRKKTCHQVSAEHGVWQVEVGLTAGAHELGDVHAWIERHDFVAGYRRNGQQSFFVDPHYRKYREKYGQPKDAAAALVKRQGAFNTIANGSMTLVVGGYVEKSGERAPYSADPTGLVIPRVDAHLPSETSRTLHGIRGAAVFGVDTARSGGTSVAVPQFTRWIANWMSGLLP